MDGVPDEIISEILSPLLKHSDEVFSDTTEKSLIVPGYSSSTYLLVCKAWLRVSTPLLYNVVILRTTAQAAALKNVLDAQPEFGLFIKKLRIEGGFGRDMSTILRCAPNITDLFLTLSIWGSDNSGGLCSGLPLINPRRVILVENREVAHSNLPRRIKPKQNKQVKQLLETLLKLIPKWDNLKTFYLPYGWHEEETAVCYSRAEALVTALRKSPTLETLSVGAGINWVSAREVFPEYLRQMRDAPSLRSIRIRFSRSPAYMPGSIESQFSRFCAPIKNDPKLKALVTPECDNSSLTEDEADEAADPLLSAISLFFAAESSLASSPGSDSSAEITPFDAMPLATASSIPVVKSIQSLENLAKTEGATLQAFEVNIEERMGPGSKSRLPAVKLGVLSPFSVLTRLIWYTPEDLPFSTPAPNFSALPNLQKLTIWSCSSSFLSAFSQLSLEALREVLIDKPVDVSSAVDFLQCHGPKLIDLSAPLEILAKAQVFDLCVGLTKVKVFPPYAGPKIAPERKALPADFITCDAPHTALVKIHLDFYHLERQNKAPMREICATLDRTSFPVLEEIQITGVQWPTSEQEMSKHDYVKCSDLLRPKGIKLTDKRGVAWTTRS